MRNINDHKKEIQEYKYEQSDNCDKWALRNQKAEERSHGGLI